MATRETAVTAATPSQSASRQAARAARRPAHTAVLRRPLTMEKYERDVARYTAT